MAEALVKGMRQEGMRDIIVSEPREERRSYLEKTYGVETTTDNVGVVNSSDVVVRWARCSLR